MRDYEMMQKNYMGPNVQRKIVQKNGIKPTNITEIKSRYGPKKKIKWNEKNRQRKHRKKNRV